MDLFLLICIYLWKYKDRYVFTIPTMGIVELYYSVKIGSHLLTSFYHIFEESFNCFYLHTILLVYLLTYSWAMASVNMVAFPYTSGVVCSPFVLLSLIPSPSLPPFSLPPSSLSPSLPPSLHTLLLVYLLTYSWAMASVNMVAFYILVG